MLTTTPTPIKDSNQVSRRTQQLRNKFLKNTIASTSGRTEEASVTQAGLLLKTFSRQERTDILKMGNIEPIEINEKDLVSLKANNTFSWNKMKVIGR